MNLDRTRLALLTAPATPLWTGTVTSWNVATFALGVSTVSGAYPANIENLLLVADGLHLVRVKSRTSNTLYLAETPIQFAAVANVALYDARLPWPRYQYIDGGVVYKDRNIAFPTPWQREMPPTAILKARLSGNDWSEAIYCAIGNTIYLNASGSYANLDGGAPLTYAWTPGAGGAITGSGATVTCAYSTAGFRYLKLVVTDAHGTTLARYLPVWVGDAHVVSHVTSARARWDVAGGWAVDLEMSSAATLLQYGQALVIDLETKNVLFFGFIVPNSSAATFEITTQTLTLQSALAFSRYVHAYPFLVTAVTGAGTPTNWAQMYNPTLARALWYLLHWHSVLPEIVNCDMASAPVRQIAGQEFTLGNIPQQMEAVLKSAFWQARGVRSGGFVVNADPLTLYTADWAGLTGFNLGDPQNLRGALRCEYAVPQYSQVRLGGVYRVAGGTFAPALVQSPQYPGPWGSPTELNGLAPGNVAELVHWAIRFIAMENAADTYTVEPGLAVDPALYRVADLPDGLRIAIEQVTLDFDPAALRWQQSVSGRAYGYNIGSAVGVPLPPPVEYPPPSLPPLLPPIWEPLPKPENPWPKRVWVGTLNLGVYATSNFTNPAEAGQPTWSVDNAGLPDMTLSRYTLMRFGGDPRDGRSQVAVVRDTGVSPSRRTIYTRSMAGTWSAALTEAQAKTLTGYSGTHFLCDVVYDALGGVLWAMYAGNSVGPFYILRSTNNGGSWSVISNTATTYCYNGALSVRGSEIAIGAGFGSGGDQHIRYSTNGGVSFTYNATSLGISLWQAYPYLFPSGKFYIAGNKSPTGAGGPELMGVNKSTLGWTTIQDAYDLGPAVDTLWENPKNSLHYRLLKSSKLWITLDGWATLVSTSPPTLTPTLTRIFMPVAAAANIIFLTQSAPNVTYPHVLYICDGESGSLLPRSGGNPGSSPYTGSIPRTCGGLALDAGGARGGGGLVVYE